MSSERLLLLGQVFREHLSVDDGDRCAGIDNHISLYTIDFYRYDQVVAVVFQTDYFQRLLSESGY